MAVNPRGIGKSTDAQTLAYGARAPKRFKWGRVYSTVRLGSKFFWNFLVLGTRKSSGKAVSSPVGTDHQNREL
jgi:hypothetical protein